MDIRQILNGINGFIVMHSYFVASLIECNAVDRTILLFFTGLLSSNRFYLTPLSGFDAGFVPINVKDLNWYLLAQCSGYKDFVTKTFKSDRPDEDIDGEEEDNDDEEEDNEDEKDKHDKDEKEKHDKDEKEEHDKDDEEEDNEDEDDAAEQDRDRDFADSENDQGCDVNDQVTLKDDKKRTKKKKKKKKNASPWYLTRFTDKRLEQFMTGLIVDISTTNNYERKNKFLRKCLASKSI